MKKAIVLATLVVVLLPVALVAKDSKDSGNSLVRFEGGIGVHPVSNVSGEAKADGSSPTVTTNVVRCANTRTTPLSDVSSQRPTPDRPKDRHQPPRRRDG